jgi:chemotaxis response regulator CheB
MSYIRVLVIYDDQLLSAGIESLLAGRLDLEVKRTTSTGNHLSKEIRNFTPHVIVLDENLGLTNISTILDLLKDYAKLRIIVVGIDNNLVNIYDKHQVMITRGNDLLTAIHSEVTGIQLGVESLNTAMSRRGSLLSG